MASSSNIKPNNKQYGGLNSGVEFIFESDESDDSLKINQDYEQEPLKEKNNQPNSETSFTNVKAAEYGNMENNSAGSKCQETLDKQQLNGQVQTMEKGQSSNAPLVAETPYPILERMTKELKHVVVFARQVNQIEDAPEPDEWEDDDLLMEDQVEIGEEEANNENFDQNNEEYLEVEDDIFVDVLASPAFTNTDIRGNKELVENKLVSSDPSFTEADVDFFISHEPNETMEGTMANSFSNSHSSKRKNRDGTADTASSGALDGKKLKF